ncbi:DUF1592 domain-containing protein [Mariniblastus fucicola]|uniref:Planctomycete cytochrome C n=1 Tax=Mariniblastus fucicola TaxID=980251 RepID=A0A5B9PR77_9BACT|nr:DUF1592 domain-containing protein [Mariniblastus fucicola]QEG25001.1 Planctomycete cytochrome C [Mariniblastus fucicola]
MRNESKTIWFYLLCVSLTAICCTPLPANAQIELSETVESIMESRCFDCHAGGGEEGGVSFDELGEMKPEESRELWHRVLKQVRTGLMPPPQDYDPLEADEKQELESWIITEALGLDPDKPLPGKVTVRRLNRVEYRNTIRDLLGYDYNTAMNFPADDTGHGFDNIGEVLSVSPLLLEKYFNAAREIIASTVPTTSKIVREQVYAGSNFRFDEKAELATTAPGDILSLLYYNDATARTKIEVDIPGDYQIVLNMRGMESYVDNVFDLNSCEFTFTFDGEVLHHKEYVRQGGKRHSLAFDRTLDAGEHEMVLTIKPTSEEDQVRKLRLDIRDVTLRGPLAEEHYVKPKGYESFFPKDVPADQAGQKTYAAELLRPFATKAFRRPADDRTVERLVSLAMQSPANGDSFESGIAKAMTAVLASPRFIFREEFTKEDDDSDFPLIDEFALASRLSFFLWSSMPDDELMRLAEQGKLREKLDSQIERMLADDRSKNLVQNFVGQWLQARAIESIPINSRAIARREQKPDPEADRQRNRFFELARKGDDRTEEEEKEFKDAGRDFRRRSRRGNRNRVRFDDSIRRAMKRETEMHFDYILKNDRSLLELIDADYAFLNEDLAKFYKIEGLEPIEGRQLKYVQLPEDSIRGGILTQGTFLAVTSNPDRTSPVKRGLFVLENILATPVAAPPPDIPSLEDAEGDDPNVKLSLRKTLAIHRENPACSSCHNRMDPLGLALENFNPMGQFRESEFGQPIQTEGELATGEAFTNIRELKKVLVNDKRDDIYRCVTEKMMTYALGRNIEYHDTPLIDQLVQKLNDNDGKAITLLTEIIHSPAFQRTSRIDTADDDSLSATESKQKLQFVSSETNE